MENQRKAELDSKLTHNTTDFPGHQKTNTDPQETGEDHEGNAKSMHPGATVYQEFQKTASMK